MIALLLSKPIRNLNILFLVLGLAATGTGCDKKEASDEQPADNLYSLSGKSQKGPFAIGSSVNVQSLDKNLSPTGDVYLGSTSDNLGSFTIAQKIKGKYIEIVLSGYYFDEIDGALSSGPLTLRSVSDVSTGSLRVNLLTSLISERIKTLVSSGSSFDDAASAAETELLAVFKIAKTSDIPRFDKMDISKAGNGNSILLAISGIFMQAAHTAASSTNAIPAQVSTLISTFVTDFAASGTISNATLAAQLVAASKKLDMVNLRTKLTEKFAELDQSAQVPNFEYYIDSDGDGVINGLFPNPQAKPISLINAPLPKAYSTMVWTGNDAIVYGGFNPDGNQNITGTGSTYKYSPVSNSWIQLSAGPPLLQHLSVWTGSKMLVWGGRVSIKHDTTTGSPLTTDFQIFDPDLNSWSTLSGGSGPSARNYATAVWSGTEMIVWGGGDFSQYHSGQCLNNGKKFNLNLNSWSDVTTTGGPSARCGHVAVWTGTKMIIWGGYNSGGTMLLDGAIYDPSTDTWDTIANSSAIPSQAMNGSDIEPVGVWDGKKMIVWLGDSGQIYDPATNTWSSMRKVINAIRSFRGSAVWDGDQLLYWGMGMCGWGVCGPDINKGFKLKSDPVAGW